MQLLDGMLSSWKKNFSGSDPRAALRLSKGKQVDASKNYGRSRTHKGNAKKYKRTGKPYRKKTRRARGAVAQTFSKWQSSRAHQVAWGYQKHHFAGVTEAKKSQNYMFSTQFCSLFSKNKLFLRNSVIFHAHFHVSSTKKLKNYVKCLRFSLKNM